MKILIKNWNIFEKENSIYFTRDHNISNEVEVLALLREKEIQYYLCLIDFYTYKALVLVKNSNNVEIIDLSIPDDWCFCNEKKYYYRDGETPADVIKKKLNDIYAPKWMIEDESFFLIIDYSYKMAMKVFDKHNKTNN